MCIRDRASAAPRPRLRPEALVACRTPALLHVTELACPQSPGRTLPSPGIGSLLPSRKRPRASPV
eukprot:10980947-Alexandrium_andersonii.AAC.1